MTDLSKFSIGGTAYNLNFLLMDARSGRPRLQRASSRLLAISSPSGEGDVPLRQATGRPRPMPCGQRRRSAPPSNS